MKLPFETDDGAAGKAAFGIILLKADETCEAELRSVFNQEGVVLYHSRVPSAKDVSMESLKEMEEELPRAVSLLPAARPFNVIGYACTSGATIIGSKKIARLVQTIQPEASVTDPIDAVMSAFEFLQTNRIGLITPYVPEVSREMRVLLEKNSFEINAFGSFEQSSEAVVARITTKSLLDAISTIGKSEDVDVVFVSCTNLRSFDILDQAEEMIKKPVISSNQALAWHMLRLAGLPARSKGPGQLFSA